MTMRRSHIVKSLSSAMYTQEERELTSRDWKKRSGNPSPKNTISGLTNPSHPSSPHLTTSPFLTPDFRTYSFEAAFLHVKQWALANDPCASTILEAGNPAIVSSVSMFWEKTRRRIPCRSRRRKK
jgi:hypothetical protein